MDERYPMFGNLSESQHEELMSLTTDQLLMNHKEMLTWHDDNCLCFNMEINDIKLSFWWIDAPYYAACVYAQDNIKAADMVIELIYDQYASYIASKEDS